MSKKYLITYMINLLPFILICMLYTYLYEIRMVISLNTYLNISFSKLYKRRVNVHIIFYVT